ncbi:BMC domain-containing protein [candidate division KSB1 bacterium]
MECKFFKKRQQIVSNYAKPALSVIELSSIAAGFTVTDDIVKKAEIDVLESTPVCPGKYLVVTGGEEGSILESYEKAKETAGKWIIDDIFIPNLHRQVIPAIQSLTWDGEYKSIGVIETSNAAASIISADHAAKNSEIQLLNIRLANGIGGKGYYVFSGLLEEVEAGISAGSEYPEQINALINKIIIPNPTREMCEFII